MASFPVEAGVEVEVEGLVVVGGSRCQSGGVHSLIKQKKCLVGW